MPWLKSISDISETHYLIFPPKEVLPINSLYETFAVCFHKLKAIASDRIVCFFFPFPEKDFSQFDIKFSFIIPGRKLQNIFSGAYG